MISATLIAASLAVQLSGVTPSVAASVLLAQGLGARFVIAPEVLALRSRVALSLDLALPLPARRQAVVSALDGMGLLVVQRGNVFFVSLKPPSAAPAAVSPELEPVEVSSTLVKLDHYQSSEVIQSLASLRDNVRAVVHPQSSNWVLLFGPTAGVAHVSSMLRQLDTAPVQVRVRTHVYEVATGSTNARAIDLALSALGLRASVDNGGSIPGAASVGISGRSIDAVIRLLDRDDRFSSIASPAVMVTAGNQAVLSSGSSVPVLGGVTASQTGQSFQSVEYRDSGLILTVTPWVTPSGIDLDYSQELSSFAPTVTSGIDSPTLSKRAIKGKLVIKPGDVVILGGLSQASDAAEKSGPFSWLTTRKVKTTSKSELVLLIEAELVPDASPPPRPQRSEDGVSDVAQPSLSPDVTTVPNVSSRSPRRGVSPVPGKAIDQALARPSAPSLQPGDVSVHPVTMHKVSHIGKIER